MENIHWNNFTGAGLKQKDRLKGFFQQYFPWYWETGNYKDNRLGGKEIEKHRWKVWNVIIDCWRKSNTELKKWRSSKFVRNRDVRRKPMTMETNGRKISVKVDGKRKKSMCIIMDG